MHNLIQDFIYAARGFRKRIGLALLAIVTLALGIGLTTAMFGITNGFLLNGLPFEEGDRIFAIVRNTSSLGTFLQTVPVRDYSDWEERQSTLEGIAAFTIATFNVSGGDRPERVLGAEMTASAFQVLRESPVLGRPFTAEDEIPGAARVAIIAHALWQDRYELDPAVIGNTIRVDGYESTIIGVMGEGFEFPFSQRVWTPLRLDPLNAGPDEGQLRVFGRLADGVSLSEAQAEFDAIAANLAQEHPQTHEGITIAIRPYVEQFVGPNARPLLFLMLGLVSLVLLIACSNVANLLLARAVARHREVAIRTALGAHRARLMTSHLIEAFVLVLLGGVGGFAVAQTGIMLFYNAITVNVRPFWLEARVEPEVLLFVGVVMLVATLVSGALPALRASKTNVADVLRDEARGSSGLRLGRLSRWLVTGEIAASGALLVGAGLMVKSLANFTSFQYDFTTEKIFTASVAAGDGDFDSEEQQLQFLEDLEVRARHGASRRRERWHSYGVARNRTCLGAVRDRGHGIHQRSGPPFDSLGRSVTRHVRDVRSAVARGSSIYCGRSRVDRARGARQRELRCPRFCRRVTSRQAVSHSHARWRSRVDHHRRCRGRHVPRRGLQSGPSGRGVRSAPPG
jgi:predicted permease